MNGGAVDGAGSPMTALTNDNGTRGIGLARQK